MRCFNTQPPEGGWYGTPRLISGNLLFQHTAARRRLAYMNTMPKMHTCFNTQPPEGGWVVKVQTVVEVQGFNTQPPEGGWPLGSFTYRRPRKRFNTQPPEGGWIPELVIPTEKIPVSTHSRPKAAGWECWRFWIDCVVSTHSRPKAAGWCPYALFLGLLCFNTQPPEGGWDNT